MEQQKESNIHQPMLGWITANPVYCRTCIFAEVREPFGRLPDTANCMIYEKPELKPDEVYFYGEPCEFYEKEKQK